VLIVWKKKKKGVSGSAREKRGAAREKKSDASRKGVSAAPSKRGKSLTLNRKRKSPCLTRKKGPDRIDTKKKKVVSDLQKRISAVWGEGGGSMRKSVLIRRHFYGKAGRSTYAT